MSKIFKIICIGTQGTLTTYSIDQNDLFEYYELYCPICKFDISIAVMNNSPFIGCKFNSFASKLYGGNIYGKALIIPEDENQFDEIFNYIETLTKSN